MKSYILPCLAVLAITLGATGISIAFMPADSSWKAGTFITEFITRHADWATAKALFFSYLFLFSGIILLAKHIVGNSSKS